MHSRWSWATASLRRRIGVPLLIYIFLTLGVSIFLFITETTATTQHLLEQQTGLDSAQITAIVFSNARRTLFIQLLSTGIFLIGLIFFYQHTLVQPLKYLINVAQELTAGNLQQRSNLQTADEFGSLGQSMNLLADRLGRAFHEQQSAQQRERAILATVDEGVLVCDLQGRIIVMNTAAYHIIGMAEAERLRHTHTKKNDQNTWYVALEALQPVFEHALGRSQHNHIAHQLSFGGRTYRVQAHPIWLEKTLLGAVASLQDISTEVEIKRLKNEWLTIASHELRTPLTTIRATVDLLNYTDTKNTLTEEQQRLLTALDHSSTNLQELVSDVLDLAQLDQQQAPNQAQTVDLHRQIEEALALLQPQIIQKRHRIQRELGQDIPRLWLDALHIQRILVNILSNAIKYTPEHGTITIRSEQRSNDILIQIQDTGVGILYKDQPRIFGRFFRADNPLSSKVGGTGLGLAITKSLVELNHGSIYFESTPEVGTTFYLSFPLALKCTHTLKHQILEQIHS